MAIPRDTIFIPAVPPPPPPPPPRIPPHSHRKLIGKILGIVFGILVFLILVGLLIWYIRKRQLDKGKKRLDVEFTIGGNNELVTIGDCDDEDEDEEEEDDDTLDQNNCNIVGVLPPYPPNMWPPQQPGGCFPPYGNGGNVLINSSCGGPRGWGGGFDGDVVDYISSDDSLSIYSYTSSYCSIDCRPPIIYCPPPRCPTPIRGRIDVVHHIPPIRVDVVGHLPREPPRVTYFEEEGGRRRVAGVTPVERAHRHPNIEDDEPPFNVRNLHMHKPHSSHSATPSGSTDTIGTFSSESDNEPTTPTAAWPAKTSWLADYPARKSVVDSHAADNLQRRVNGANRIELCGRTIQQVPAPSMQNGRLSSLDPQEIGMNILAGIMSQWPTSRGGALDPASGGLFTDSIDRDHQNSSAFTPNPSSFPLPPFRDMDMPAFFERGFGPPHWPTPTARIIEEEDDQDNHLGRQNRNGPNRPPTPIPRQGIQPALSNGVMNGRGPRFLNDQQRRVHWADDKNDFQDEPFAPRPQRRVNWGTFGDIPSGFGGQGYPDPDF